MQIFNSYPVLSRIVDLQLQTFPQHTAFIERRLVDVSPEQFAFLEQTAVQIQKLCGDNLQEYLDDYAWLADEVLKEELAFRRTGRYRLSTFEEAERTVYADPLYMRRYMNGLLLTQLWWRNHSLAIQFYRDEFLDQMPAGSDFLEIGPGHGLLLFLATQSKAANLSAWDVSPTSLKNTEHALKALGATRDVTLNCQNLFDAPAEKFDRITLSEVLEHLDEPLKALKVLRSLLNDGGKLYVHAPANSPAPDHLHLFKHPQEVVDMIAEAGFSIDKSAFYPGTGATLDRAIKFDLAVSVVVIATAI